jgi:hypothetical protein
MSTQVSFHFGASHRDWLTLRASTNPFSATGGPLLRLNVPLEARLSDRDIEVDILRFPFDLQLGSTVIGQGEIGPIDYLSTGERYVTAVATCPREALPYLLNPQPPQGRLTLQLNLGGLLRYRHQFPAGEGRAQGLGEPEVWHTVSIGEKGTHQLEVQVARSDWYEQVVAQLGVGGYLIAPCSCRTGCRPGSPRSTTSSRRGGLLRRLTRRPSSATAVPPLTLYPAPSSTSSTP